MQTKNLLSSLIFCLLAMPCLSQQNTEEAFGTVLQSLHKKLTAPEKQEVQAFKALFEKWDSAYVPYNQKRSFTLGVRNEYVMKGRPARQFSKSVKKNLPRLSPAYDDQDLEVIKSNTDLVDLIEERLVGFNDSFPLAHKTLLYKELEEYGLKNGMKIGEIGAGSGLISMLIASVYDNLEVHINEVNEDRVAYMESKLKRFTEIRKSNKVQVVKGYTNQCKLGFERMDLIFMRDVFHHFKNKEAMLQSIHYSLSDRGTVLVKEAVLDHWVDASKCKATLTKAAVISMFEKGGFKLVKQLEHGYEYIFTFQKK